MNKQFTIKTLSFNINKTSHEVDISKLPVSTIDRLLQYGTRILNDKINSEASKAAGEGKSYDKDEAAAVWIQKAIEGKLGERTARSTDPRYKILKELVVGKLAALGITKADAAKLCKSPLDGFKTFIELVLSTKQGIAVAKLDPKQVQAAIEKNWPKLEAKAEQIAALAQDTLDIEI